MPPAECAKGWVLRNKNQSWQQTVCSALDDPDVKPKMTRDGQLLFMVGTVLLPSNQSEFTSEYSPRLKGNGLRGHFTRVLS